MPHSSLSEPAQRPARSSSPGAVGRVHGNAADRAVPRVVQRVVRDLVDGDVGLDALRVPVDERVDLPDAVALRPLHLGRLRAARRLLPPDARDPGAVGLERGQQRLDLADVAAAVGIPLPQVWPLLHVLLGHGDDGRRGQQLQAVALDEPVARLIGLAEEELRVELDDRDLEVEVGDHVHEHRRLLLPRAGQAEAGAELPVRPAQQILGGHGLEVEVRKLGRDRQGAPPSACRRAGRGAGSRAG